MRRGIYIFWAIFIAAALVRFIYSFGYEAPSVEGCVRKVVQGTGRITKEPERKDSGQVFIVETSSLNAGDTQCGESIFIRMKTKLYPRLSHGEVVSFTGTLSQPFNFKSDSGRSFDYQGYLAKDEVYYEIKSATVELKDENDRAFSLSSMLFTLKRKFVHNLESALGDPHAALAAGLVVGEKSALGKDLINDFRIVGLIHIVVLSGFNITIVADALRRMLIFLPRVWGITIGGMGIALFGILVGGGATVVRSCFMAGVALSADLIRRDYHVVRALMFAGLLMIIQNPLILLNDPSFQLSFLATLGLILLASPIESKLGFITEKFGMRGIVASTLATQIFVSPYILYMMGTMSIIGMVVNVLVLPIIPLTMLLVFLTGAAGFIWPFLAQLFGWVTHLLLSYELLMVEKFAKVPYAAIEVPMFSFLWVVVFYVCFSGIFYWMRRRRKDN